MPTAIATLEEYAVVVPVDDLGRADTDELQAMLDAAAGLCQRYTSRLFEPDPPFDVDGNDTGTAVIRRFPARGRTRIKIPDLRVATAVTLDGVSLTANVGYYIEAYPTATSIQLVQGSAFISSMSAGELAITGRWGMLQAPDEIKRSILEYAARKYHQKTARWSDQVTPSMEGGTFSYFRSIPDEIRMIWDQYRQPNLAIV